MNPRMQSRVDAMTTGLSLTPDQVTQVTQIMTDFLQKRKQIKRSGTADEGQLVEARKTMRQSVENIFNAGQKSKYEANKKQYWHVDGGGDDDDSDNDDNASK